MSDIKVTWTQMKDFISNKTLSLQYLDELATYVAWAQEGTDTYRCEIMKGTADATDFENNYQADANGPVFMGEDVMVDAHAVRDTNEHTSNVSDNRGAIPKTLIIHNDLNAAMTFTLEGSRDAAFTVPITVGTSFQIGSLTKDYAVITDYFPFLRLKYDAVLLAPSSGTLTVYLEKVRST